MSHYFQGMDHSPGFLNLANEAKKHINEISVAEARARLAQNPRAILLDVREDHEWLAGLERDLEKLYPDPRVEIIMYCGGGFRSALTCDAAQKMGYRNVHSVIGGYKAMVQGDWAVKAGA